MRVSTTNFQNAFGKYLKTAVDKEDVIVTKNGRAIAKLIHYEDPLIKISKDGLGDYMVSKRISYDEYVDLSTTSDARYELIDGELYLMASPKHKHQVILGEVFVQYHKYFADKKCSPVMAPFDVRLSNGSVTFEEDPNVVQPDLIVICDEENIDENGVYHGVPTLVVEVLSSSTRNKDMLIKLSLYMKSGVKEYWIIDTDNNSIYVYIFEKKEIKLMKTFSFDDEVISDFFEGLKIKISY